jgi:hypothetical protein
MFKGIFVFVKFDIETCMKEQVPEHIVGHEIPIQCFVDKEE